MGNWKEGFSDTHPQLWAPSSRLEEGREEKTNINATSLLKAILQSLRVVMGGEVYSMRPASQTNYTIL